MNSIFFVIRTTDKSEGDTAISFYTIKYMNSYFASNVDLINSHVIILLFFSAYN
jgi:hypothetical protein